MDFIVCLCYTMTKVVGTVSQELWYCVLTGVPNNSKELVVWITENAHPRY